MECSKILLIIINIIFMIFGIACLAGGIVLKLGFDVIKEALVAKGSDIDFNLKYAGETLGIGMIAFGVFILLVSFLGCAGACCRVRCLLVVYAIIVMVILVAQIAVVVLAVIKGSEASDILDKGLKKALDGYHEDPKKKDPKDKSFDALFSTFSCCGVDNYTDFKSLNTSWDNRNPQKKIPVTCCKGVNYEDITNKTFVDHAQCLTTPTKGNAYIEGCYSSLVDEIKKYKGIAIGVGIVIFLVEIVVIGMAFFLCSRHDD
ncbi:CD63 antigen-like isoform X2 [Gigantopelta aegis]|uniref:CD63 antigen-like isoform X2 n=1 Tax=Gigantopelta aegis TaxID=1735272 RepID=UPI001B88BF2D|nr:CD63 antigen-like isoform X2 [Gigantopelta aegis]